MTFHDTWWKYLWHVIDWLNRGLYNSWHINGETMSMQLKVTLLSTSMGKVWNLATNCNKPGKLSCIRVIYKLASVWHGYHFPNKQEDKKRTI